MAHFAELDDNGCVRNVVVLSDSVLAASGDDLESYGIDFLESLFGHRRWKQTSYTGAIRGRYAAVGMRYDATKDEFLSLPDGCFFTDGEPEYGQRVEFFDSRNGERRDVGNYFGQKTEDGMLVIRLGMPWSIWKTATHWRPTENPFASDAE